MKFTETKLKGAYLIELEPIDDERGFFARSFCQKEFEEQDINFQIAQCNISYNIKRGTLRGMHYQAAPYEEAKLVSCPHGSIYDVIIDLRPGSLTYCEWTAFELDGKNYRMIYVPKGFAHGFQTLKDNTVVLYQMSEFYYSECARGVRWDDPLFRIKWPYPPTAISGKDQSYPYYKKLGK